MEDPGQGLPPPLPGQHGAPALRLRRRQVHRLREGRRRQHHRGAVRIPARLQVRHPGADNVKVKGNLHWVSVEHAYTAEVRLYDRLFPRLPGAAEGDRKASNATSLDDINPTACGSSPPSSNLALRAARPEARFQFERHGYFVADRVDSRDGAPVFNRTVTLRDTWKK